MSESLDDGHHHLEHGDSPFSSPASTASLSSSPLDTIPSPPPVRKHTPHPAQSSPRLCPRVATGLGEGSAVARADEVATHTHSPGSMNFEPILIDFPPIFADRYMHLHQKGASYVGYVFKVHVGTKDFLSFSLPPSLLPLSFPPSLPPSFSLSLFLSLSSSLLSFSFSLSLSFPSECCLLKIYKSWRFLTVRVIWRVCVVIVTSPSSTSKSFVLLSATTSKVRGGEGGREGGRETETENERCNVHAHV